MPMLMQRKASETIHCTARNLMSLVSVVKGRLNTVISDSKKFAVAWQLEATNVVQAVVLHQATMKPKNRP